ncbi:hypothetical protein HYH03_006023 [Edaphochlamys debaryana]|uniref:Guanylate cyclase domain-containing protein n=1 Tax=Edaphochlamys debaryana TaxID=47281 RepID=A0A836C1M3_9CHLO|nr:hypothetical protein HYH03_006023 [Edaphochlamys debaryana]|eukprot:KAG2495778.1 hypothetical protein HYH03_006023 [Edaphochlamys debaryana]
MKTNSVVKTTLEALVFTTDDAVVAVGCTLTNAAAVKALGLADEQDVLRFLAVALERDPALSKLFHEIVMRLLAGVMSSVSHFVPGDFGEERYFLSLRMSPLALSCGEGRGVTGMASPSVLPALVLELDAPYESKGLAARLQRDYLCLSSIPLAVTIFDPSGRVLHQNKASIGYMGYRVGLAPTPPLRGIAAENPEGPAAQEPRDAATLPPRDDALRGLLLGSAGTSGLLKQELWPDLFGSSGGKSRPRALSRLSRSLKATPASVQGTEPLLSLRQAGSARGAGDSTPLNALFALEPAKLQEAMESCQRGREWTGLVRVPPRLGASHATLLQDTPAHTATSLARQLSGSLPPGIGDPGSGPYNSLCRTISELQPEPLAAAGPSTSTAQPLALTSRLPSGRRGVAVPGPGVRVMPRAWGRAKSASAQQQRSIIRQLRASVRCGGAYSQYGGGPCAASAAAWPLVRRPSLLRAASVAARQDDGKASLSAAAAGSTPVEPLTQKTAPAVASAAQQPAVAAAPPRIESTDRSPVLSERSEQGSQQGASALPAGPAAALSEGRVLALAAQPATRAPALAAVSGAVPMRVRSRLAVSRRGVAQDQPGAAEPIEVTDGSDGSSSDGGAAAEHGPRRPRTPPASRPVAWSGQAARVAAAAVGGECAAWADSEGKPNGHSSSGPFQRAQDWAYPPQALGGDRGSRLIETTNTANGQSSGRNMEFSLEVLPLPVPRPLLPTAGPPLSRVALAAGGTAAAVAAREDLPSGGGSHWKPALGEASTAPTSSSSPRSLVRAAAAAVAGTVHSSPDREAVQELSRRLRSLSTNASLCSGGVPAPSTGEECPAGGWEVSAAGAVRQLQDPKSRPDPASASQGQGSPAQGPGGPVAPQGEAKPPDPAGGAAAAAERESAGGSPGLVLYSSPPGVVDSAGGQQSSQALWSVSFGRGMVDKVFGRRSPGTVPGSGGGSSPDARLPPPLRLLRPSVGRSAGWGLGDPGLPSARTEPRGSAGPSPPPAPRAASAQTPPSTRQHGVKVSSAVASRPSAEGDATPHRRRLRALLRMLGSTGGGRGRDQSSIGQQPAPGAPSGASSPSLTLAPEVGLSPWTEPMPSAAPGGVDPPLPLHSPSPGPSPAASPQQAGPGDMAPAPAAVCGGPVEQADGDAAAGSDGSVCEKEERHRFHEISVRPCADPLNSEPLILVVQTDVTSKIRAEAALVEAFEAEHRLLSDIFPAHVLRHMTAARRAKAAQERQQRGPYAGGLGLLKHIQDPAKLATHHESITVLFADIKGFTQMSKEVPAAAVMIFLNDLYTRFDSLNDLYGVYKVETIGDCYMVAGGLMASSSGASPGGPRSAGGGAPLGYGRRVRGEGEDADPLHALRVVEFARAMLAEASKVALPNTGEPVEVRVGIHSGPATSGVVGQKMPRFCLFGDTINTASRMESTGYPGSIHISAATRSLLPPEEDAEGWEANEALEVKGKGQMETFSWRPRGAGAGGNSGGGRYRTRRQQRKAMLLGTLRDNEHMYGSTATPAALPAAYAGAHAPVSAD